MAKKIFISTRTDGQEGSGTCNDPYDGSSVDKFDSILRDKVEDNTEINLFPGIFETRGFRYNDYERSVRLKPGCKLRGAGDNLTTVKLVEASEPGQVYFVIAANYGYQESSKEAVWTSTPNYFYYDDCEISDLTIDCNYNGQPANNPQPTIGTHGIQIIGNRTKVSRVRIIHFGNAVPNEMFLVYVGAPAAWAGDIQDILIDGCVVELPHFIKRDSGGVSGFIIGGGESWDGTTGYITNSIVRNCIVDGKYPDGFIPYPSNPADPYPEGKKPLNFGLWSNGRNGVVENCEVRNGTFGVYMDTWDISPIVIRNNSFYNVSASIYVLLGGTSPFTGKKWLSERIVIENNDIAIQLVSGNQHMINPVGIQLADYYDAEDLIFKEVIIRNNRIHLLNKSMDEKNYCGGGIVVCSAEYVELKNNTIHLPYVNNSSFNKRGSIFTRRVKSLNCCNNIRPEDGSTIIPWDDHNKKWLSDDSYEAEKMLMLNLFK
jgi:hypothetical protein